MSSSDHSSESRFSDLSTSDASKLLQLGLNIPERPIDQLMDRLNQPDGLNWLDLQLSEEPISMFGSPKQLLVKGDITLDQLKKIKQQSKKLLSSHPDYSSRMQATIGYFFSIAASLLHHQTLLSNRKREEIKAAMDDLSAITSDPWSDFFKSASQHTQTAETMSNPSA